MKRKSEKQLARETSNHISMVERSRREASWQSEMALLTAAPVLCFNGQLVIQSREVATSKAIETSPYNGEQLAYFTASAVHISPKKNIYDLEKRRTKVRLAAAAAYKATESIKWTVTSFSVPPGARSHYLQAGMAGIAGALAMAITSIISQRREATVTFTKVIIMTDCEAAIHQLQKLQKLQDYTKEQIQGYTLIRKLITRYQYLRYLGIPLEIHWIPGHHKDIAGNLQANSGARRTAKCSNITVYEEELIQIPL